MRSILAFIVAVSVASAAMVPDQFVPMVPASQVYGGQVVYVQQPTVVYVQRVEPIQQVVVVRNVEPVYVVQPVSQVVVVQRVEPKPAMTIGGKHWKVRVW